jgi:predicted RNase H-like HicB family nuclease
MESFKVFCSIEQADGEYLACCDELRAVASGDTEEAALTNLRAAIKELLKQHGEQIFSSSRKRLLVEVV